jgi:hypothetical protein
VEKLKGIRLSAKTYAEQPSINRALVYCAGSLRCRASFLSPRKAASVFGDAGIV